MIFSSPPVKRIIAVLLVVAAGILLRNYGPAHHVPAFYVHYGYWALWAAMIYFVVALLLPSRPQNQILFIAALVCALVEASKLSHTPALAVFRLTLVGGWLMGKAFSYWNFVAYAVGLAAAFGLDAILAGNPSGKSRGRRR